MGEFHLLMPPHCLAKFLLSLSPTSTALGIISPSVIQGLKREKTSTEHKTKATEPQNSVIHKLSNLQMQPEVASPLKQGTTPHHTRVHKL